MTWVVLKQAIGSKMIELNVFVSDSHRNSTQPKRYILITTDVINVW